MTKPYFYASSTEADFEKLEVSNGLLTMTALSLVAAPTPKALIHTLKTATECTDTLMTAARVITSEQTFDGHVTTTPLLDLIYKTLHSTYEEITIEELRDAVEQNQELTPIEFKEMFSDLLISKHNAKRGTNYESPKDMAEGVFSAIFK